MNPIRLVSPGLLLALAGSFTFLIHHPANYSTSTLLMLGCLAGGILAGVIAGLFGMGSIVLVPVLSYVLAKSGVTGAELAHVSVATSLAASSLISALAILAHAKAGTIRFDVFKSLAIGAVIGGVGGSLLSGLSRPGLVFGAVAALQLVAVFAVLNGWIGVKASSRDELQPMECKISTGNRIGFSTLIGFITSFTGIGAGPIFTPYLLATRLPFQQAVGTSLAISLATTVAASIAMLASGKLGVHPSTLIHWPEVIALAFGSALSIKAGACAGRILSMTLIRHLLVLMLLLSVAQLAVRSLA